ncbi:predicted protein [Naegleria gruberi]|uniref:Predicted protein n=1 Tax=Naegleria gruberi TaxID=5762 RepID=D2VU40_NAEGR|nr:uncharacterized protein NAEGRDRAFT_73184 [Naegleria gruberi]XP_002672306.1 uncharacterized protein NAEGRDRAFT_72527 [Naegleria gruberi]EFC38924.1 predicted protein [Naegleria gruberi]EFC39562.1 predicted protein [Naegleria gruberi]|eukprot:XP_002671668.1 predicted protein [Naegleria gruberi strain NEG-M]
MCWKYNTNTREQIVSFLSISIDKEPNQKLLNEVIASVAPTIVELKTASQTMEEKKTDLLSGWLSTYGFYPKGNGQPIERVIGFIVTNWASPSTTLHILLNARNIRNLLNTRPASSEVLMFSLMNYLNSLNSLAYSSKPVCSRLECH